MLQDKAIKFTEMYFPRIANARSLAIAAFLLGVLVMLTHRPFTQNEGGDTAFYDYVAQSVLRGQIPYRDVVDIKWPGAAYLSALSMLIGRVIGTNDVISVRLLNILLVGALSALIFLVASQYLRSRVAGVIATLSVLMIPRFADWMTAGTEPKLPLMVFGMLSLFLLARDKPFWAGLTSMLACLCWQPGLMFTGVTVLLFSRYLTSWRDMRAIKACIGAVIPFVAMLSYFYAQGALGDLWAWTITYNDSVFGPQANEGVLVSLGHIWKVTNRILGLDIAIAILSAFGFLLFIAERVRVKVKGRELLSSPDLFRDAVLFPPVIYLAFSVINFQAGPDLIPFIPFIGIFAAKLLVDAGSFAHLKLKPLKVGWEVLVPGAVIALMFLLILVRSAASYRLPGALRHQREEFKKIESLLGPDDKMYVHGAAEILVLLNRPNLNPYLFMDWGADEFAASRKGGSFQAIIDEMEAEAPKIVVLARLKMVAHRDELTKWAEKNYVNVELPAYEGFYQRKQASAGLR